MHHLSSIECFSREICSVAEVSTQKKSERWKSPVSKVTEYLTEIMNNSSCHNTVTPSSLFLDRRNQTRLVLLKLSCESHVLTKQGQQKIAHDIHAKP